MILLSCPIFSFIFLSCSDKTTDTAITITDTNDTVEYVDTDNSEDTNNNENADTDNNPNSDDSENNTSPTVGSWTVNGPEFTTNTCGGGESFPNPRTMTLGLNESTLTLLIEEANERSYTFTCTLTGSTFTCGNIEIENSIPMLPCTLYYTHTLQGVFTDVDSLEGDYTIFTTSSGGSGCSESNLGFTTPCEQAGGLSATSNN
jgi:hypothetical protein